jgi:NADPH:quinone reductase-like Zn-dependent oxidoreductase
MLKAIQVDTFSDDFSQVKLVEKVQPGPGPGEVRVRMLLSAVNPSDLNYIRGDYYHALQRLVWNSQRGDGTVFFDPECSQPYPSLPYTLGGEGVGIVDACGSGFLARRLQGRRVAISAPPPQGTWQQYVVVDAKRAVVVPDGLSDEQAAMFFINPLSSWLLIKQVLKVRRGGCLLQDAAGSALAKNVIRMGKQQGFRTINIVRNERHRAELEALGADVVVATDSEELIPAVSEATAGKGVDYALDCVGGELAGDMIRCLTLGGHMVLFGTLANQAVKLSSRDLMMPLVQLSGFFAGAWLAQQSPLKILMAIRQVRRLLERGVLGAEVGQIYDLGQAREALAASVQPGREGKILLRLAELPE